MYTRPVNRQIDRLIRKTNERGTWEVRPVRITRRILISYRRRLEARENENANEAELEYWMNRNLVFEVYAGDRAAFGGDLLWILRR